jgi:hypothetical protein
VTDVEREQAWSPEALRKAVERLAAPERDGVTYLRSLGTYPQLDELALSFSEELLRVRDDLPVGHPLLALDEQLDEMSGQQNAGLWAATALQEESWTTVRRLARSSLEALSNPAP